YKETELGWMPKEWEVCLLRDKINEHGFVQTGPFGSQLHSYEYVDNGVPVIMPQDLLSGRVSLKKIAKITEKKQLLYLDIWLRPMMLFFLVEGISLGQHIFPTIEIMLVFFVAQVVYC
ncbi:MAG: hypothetical protein ACR2PT_23855, partial [Endozoicomonas sp.]